MQFSIRSCALLGGAALACVAAGVWASPNIHAGDVILQVTDGKVETGSFDGSSLNFPGQIWTQGLGQQGGGIATNDPGFDAASGVLPNNVLVGLAIRKALRVWDESSGDFDTIASPETISITRFQVTIDTPANDPESPDLMPELILAQTSGGSLHGHPVYTLNNPGGGGVYLLEIEVWVNAAGIEPSDPVWIIFGHNAASETMDEARIWVEDNLLNGGATCAGDLTGSGNVDVFDLLALLDAWGSTGESAADLNGDGTVDVFDLLILLDAWGSCP